MRKEIVIGVILILIFGVIIGYYVAGYYRHKAAGPITGSNSNTNQTVLTAGVVAQHATPADCWIVIQGIVYDVTRYLKLHPGGGDIIIPHCGQDATQAFQTKAGRGAHSSVAYVDLASYHIGALDTNNSNAK
ncbi:MAG: cytochrome b5-like heme/steroid binding domain-containing protein [Patescibacteria group bacterium]